MQIHQIYPSTPCNTHQDVPSAKRNTVLSHRLLLHLQLNLGLGTAAAEDDGGGQAGDGLVVLGVDIGEDRVLALRWLSVDIPHFPTTRG